MKAAIFLLLILIGCGAIDRSDCYINGKSCSEVSAPSPLPGPPGPQGPAGYNIAIASTSVVECAGGVNGTTIFLGRDLDRNGKLRFVPEAEIVSFTVCDGQTGPRGATGSPAPYTPVSFIDPCGPQSAFDEILVVLADHTILASFSDSTSGQNTRFTLLKPGDYMTTDNTFCKFTIDSNYQIINQHN